MKVDNKKLDEIKPYEHNPRNNASAVGAVKESIKEFGFRQPIVVDKDGVIVAGHTRYLAAKELGMDAVPCVTADDLTDEQVRAYRLADNKTAELAKWDIDLLDKELFDLPEIDMGLFGFTVDDNEYDFSEFDEETERLVDKEMASIHIFVPAKSASDIKKWLANGNDATAYGMGRGIMQRCGLL